MFHLVTLPREQGETLIYLFKYNRGMGTQQKPTAHQHGHRDSVWGASHIPNQFSLRAGWAGQKTRRRALRRQERARCAGLRENYK